MSVEKLTYPSPYYEYRFFMEKRYGKSLYKVPLDFEFSCPHRDTDAKGGCTFCSEDGSKATQIKGISDLKDQIKASMAFAKTRYKATGFTAYVQAYTATFAPLKVFREKIEAVLDEFPFDSLHLGTRPDCLPPKTLDYLKELSNKVDLWVELGLQTSHNKTLNAIRRGHDWDCALKGLDKLKSKDLQVVTHAILGLPGETEEDMMETAQTFSKLPFDGIKIHNLHIIKDTEMAREYQASPLPLINELEYVDLVSKYLQYLPADLPVMRINTDTPPQELVAPHWGIQKGQLKKTLIDHMTLLGRKQGDHYPEPDTQQNPSTKIKILSTLDGSKTCLNPHHGEAYHPKYGALRHAHQKFIEPLPETIWERGQTNDLNLLDIGFGLGYNSFSFLEVCKSKSIKANIIALENNFVQTKSFQNQHANSDWNELLNSLIEHSCHKNSKHNMEIMWGDARHQSQKCSPNSFDLIFLDSFHEKNNAELVTFDFFSWLKHLLKDDGLLLFSRSHVSILNGLIEAGFILMKSQKDSKSYLACLNFENFNDFIPIDIDQIIANPKGKPYRDPHLCLPHRDIVRKREA